MNSAKRMTANPVKPNRYRPGKALPEAVTSSEEESELSDNDAGSEEDSLSITKKTAPPKSSALSSVGAVVAKSLKNVDLEARKTDARRREAARLEQAKRAVLAFEDGFVTEESGAESVATEDSSAASGSSDEEAELSEDDRRRAVRPTFIRKDQRKTLDQTLPQPETDQDFEAQVGEAETRRKAAADEMLREQLRKDAEARAAGRKGWDDDDEANLGEVDDTDDLEPEAEYAAWRLRELKRIKRDRETIEEAERERAEVERRKGLSREDRDVEDAAYLAKQKEERDSRGTMSYMQKYHHKGAFFQGDDQAAGVGNRDLMGSRFQDEGSRELLPEYLQVRDATKLGRKGRTKYKDMRSEDTGNWGGPSNHRKGEKRDFGGTRDERFQPDDDMFGGREDKRPRYA